ncbi:hypothetical protein EXIGLDRAFT_719014, partial [Exidia glandulosa HHB12029]
MATSRLAATRRFLSTDQSLIARIETELSEVDKLHATHAHALKDAQAAFSLTEARRTELVAYMDAVRLSMSQRAASSSAFECIPDEILAEIFTRILPPFTVSRAVDLRPWDLMKPDADRLRLLCDLPRVSKRWKAVVERTRSLHTYLVVPSDLWSSRRRQKLFFTRLDFILDRAPCIDLHVIATHPRSGLQPNDYHDYDDFWHRVFRILYSTTHRLRTLCVVGDVEKSERARPRDRVEQVRDMTAGLLRLPTPNLEAALISFESDHPKPWGNFPEVPLPLYLPVAPKLHWLYLDNIPVMCTDPLRHPGLPSLETLRIRNDDVVYVCHLWDMLSISPSLHDLSIDVEHLDEGTNSIASTIPNPPASIPIRRLALDDRQGGNVFEHPSHTSLPNLTDVAVPWVASSDELFNKIKDTVTYLEITRGDLQDETFLIPFAILRNVHHVSIAADLFDMDAFMDLMSRPHDPMWPRLRTLEFYVDDRWADEHGDALIRLVEARQERSARKDSDVSPLEKVVVGKDYLAGWALAVLRGILGDANVTEG